MEEYRLTTQPVDLPTLSQTKTVFQAAATGDMETLKWHVEIQHQALEARDAYNRTALMWAALKGQVEVFSYLIGRSQSAQQLEVMGVKEALTLTIFQGHGEIIKRLSLLSE